MFQKRFHTADGTILRATVSDQGEINFSATGTLTLNQFAQITSHLIGLASKVSNQWEGLHDIPDDIESTIDIAIE